MSHLKRKAICSLRTLAFGAIAALLVAGAARRAAAQGAMSCHMMGMRDEVTPEKLPPPQKLAGIGNAHLRVTATPEAQMWFDQGLNLLHDFWDYESARAFEQAVRVDPQCAMCYWGIYRAEIFTHSNSKYFANTALAKARSLEGHASKTERLYIEASVAAAAANSDSDSRSAGESKQVQLYRKLVKREPKDMQARIFLAEAVSDGYDDDGQPRAGQKEALAILQSVLKEDPKTPRQIITGFTRSKPARIQSRRCTARKFSAASRLLPGTWSTCPATSSIAWVITRARKTPLPLR